MSAWYVMSALGFYPLTPGVPQYEIGTPRFDDVTLKLPEGCSLHLVAKGAEAGALYIRAIESDGQPVQGHTLTHSRLMQGGELVFTMGLTPTNLSPGISNGLLPNSQPSQSQKELRPPPLP